MLFYAKEQPDIFDVGRPDWPSAVQDFFILDPTNEGQKCQRAQDIVELLISENLIGKRFLDFGCGEGHVARHIANLGAAISIGYDLLDSGDCTSSIWNEVVAKGPYDVILLFDVLDHLVRDDIFSVLWKVKSVLAENGHVYLRVHPITSRHACHQYHDCNKAFIHLLLPEERFVELCPHSVKNTGDAKYPLRFYKEYFDRANFEIVKTRMVRDNVEDIFRQPEFATKICKTLQVPEFPDFQMTISFVDYILRGIK